MHNSTGEIIETLNVILAKMAAKDDLAGFATKEDLGAFRAEMHEEFVSTRADIRTLRDEIREIRARLDAIGAELKDHRGYAKEIDHLLQRVGAIEQHFGLDRKIAA